MSFVRATSKISRVAVRAPVYRSTPVAWNAQRAFSQSAVRCSDAHAEETFEEFTARYDAFLEGLRARMGEGDIPGQKAAIELQEAHQKLYR
jgi:cytochrome c peroxidase